MSGVWVVEGLLFANAFLVGGLLGVCTYAVCKFYK